MVQLATTSIFKYSNRAIGKVSKNQPKRALQGKITSGKNQSQSNSAVESGVRNGAQTAASLAAHLLPVEGRTLDGARLLYY